MKTPIGSLLTQALAQHTSADPDGVYDETLRVVTTRAAAAQSLCKADIGSLVMWKRITASARWAGALGMTPDTEVRAITRKAWRLVHDDQLPTPEAGLAAFRELRRLPGLGGTGALASAVLVACAPDRMAVWDRRVSSALAAMGRRPVFGSGFYGRYLEELNRLIEEDLGGADPQIDNNQTLWRPRDVDLALYALGGDRSLLNQVDRLSKNA